MSNYLLTPREIARLSWELREHGETFVNEFKLAHAYAVLSTMDDFKDLTIMKGKQEDTNIKLYIMNRIY